MALIGRVEITGFRSLQHQVLDDVGSLTALVGKNSTGKSNVLRALNLFFNGEVEPGKALDFFRDHYEEIPRIRRKKRIEVAVSFKLPPQFRLRRGLEPLQALGDRFVVRRSWELDKWRRPFESLTVEVDGQPVPNGSDLARQFLQLVFFRYIPNRTVPSDLLRQESQAIADLIFSRMKGDRHAAKLLEALASAAGRMLEEAAGSLEEAGSPLQAPSVATPESIGEMLTMSGFQALGPHGETVQDEDWGAGHQAFFLYEVLHALDATNYGRFFGWRQATVWGVEEPESALHQDLETRLASQLRSWCLDPRYRLQVLETTHSPIFSMAADAGYWVDLEGPQTVLERMEISSLTRAAERRGVSGWVPPALAFPWNPIVLVEGPRDVRVFEHVATVATLTHFRFLSLPALDPDESGGGRDAIIKYLRRNRAVVQNRLREAPLMVLLDWDTSNQDLKRACEAYGPGADRAVHRMNAEYAPPELGRDFRGIERFYPARVIMEAHHSGELILGVAEGKPYSIARSQLDGAKGPLLRRVLAVDSTEELAPLIRTLVDLEGRLREDGPVQIFLPTLQGDASAPDGTQTDE